METGSPIAHYVLSSIAHDLRSPLNAVIGFSKIMINGLDGPLSDIQMTDLQAVYDNGKQMLDMVNHIIDLAKIETGTLTADDEVVYLDPLTEKAVSQAQAFLQNRDIQLKPELEDLLLSVQGDETQLKQALVDLIAVMAHWIEAGTLTLHAGRQEQHMIIRVQGHAQDTLSPDTQPIIQAFESAGASLDHRVDALSLKLLVSQKRIGMHGGTLQARIDSATDCALICQLPIHRPPA